MSHSCSHHGHPHPAPTGFHGAFAIGIALNSAFIGAELAAGYWAQSLALVADAVHNLGDVLGLLAAWFGYYLSTRKPSQKHTLGLGRMSIYTTILNGLFLVASSAWIMVEAVERFQNPEPTKALIVVIVAVIGIAVNLSTAFALLRGQHDINIKGAMLHMLGDAGISAAVAVAAGLIAMTGWMILDPAISFAVALIILGTSWPLLKEGLHLAMDGVPLRLNPDDIKTFIQSRPEVTEVHDLQIWPLSTTKTALSAHIVLKENTANDVVLKQLQHDLRHQFDLAHVTLQIEQSHMFCAV